MRDLMFASAMLLAIPLAFLRPFNAYLLWGWTGMLVPTSYFYGFMADARLNFVFAVVTIAMILLGKVKLVDYQNNRVTWLYLLFLAHCSMAFLLGYPDNPFNPTYYERLSKALVFALAMPFFIRERFHFHVMFLVIALGLAFHGVLDGLKTLASAGGHNMIGVPGSMMGDRNHLSLALVLSLPILYYLFIHSRERWVRLGMLGVLAIVAVAVLGSGSRGAFLALGVVALWLVATSRHKAWALTMVLVAAVAFAAFAPERWTNRLATIQEAQVDDSFMGRVYAWRVSSAIALENPVFGGGFHAVQVQHVWDEFKAEPGLLGFLGLPVPEFHPKAAHSIYFELMGDTGMVGLLIFLAILGQALWSRFQIVRAIYRSDKQLGWARDMADMLMVSLVAYLVGGSVASLGYFEVVYMLIMLMELLRLHVMRKGRNGSGITARPQ